MEQRHRDLLRSSKAYLIKDINLDGGLLALLESKYVFTPQMVTSIKSAGNEFAQKTKLLDSLPGRKKCDFQLFCEALAEDGQEHLVEQHLAAGLDVFPFCTTQDNNENHGRLAKRKKCSTESTDAPLNKKARISSSDDTSESSEVSIPSDELSSSCDQPLLSNISHFSHSQESRSDCTSRDNLLEPSNVPQNHQSNNLNGTVPSSRQDECVVDSEENICDQKPCKLTKQEVENGFCKAQNKVNLKMLKMAKLRKPELEIIWRKSMDNVTGTMKKIKRCIKEPKKITYSNLNLHAKLHIKNYAVGVIAEAADSKFTSDMLEKLDSFEKASKDFKSLGATLVNMMEGCVKCALRFENLQNLFNFWIKYQLGEVSDFLTLRYVTDELRELEDGADLIVDVYIEEEEYSRVWDYYSSEGAGDGQSSSHINNDTRAENLPDDEMRVGSNQSKHRYPGKAEQNENVNDETVTMDSAITEKDGYENNTEDVFIMDKTKSFESDDDDLYRNQMSEIDETVLKVFQHLADPCHQFKWQMLAKELGFQELQIKHFENCNKSEREQRMEFLRAYERCNRGNPLMVRDLVFGLNMMGHLKLASVVEEMLCPPDSKLQHNDLLETAAIETKIEPLVKFDDQQLAMKIEGPARDTGYVSIHVKEQRNVPYINDQSYKKEYKHVSSTKDIDGSECDLSSTDENTSDLDETSSSDTDNEDVCEDLPQVHSDENNILETAKAEWNTSYLANIKICKLLQGTDKSIWKELPQDMVLEIGEFIAQCRFSRSDQIRRNLVYNSKGPNAPLLGCVQQYLKSTFTKPDKKVLTGIINIDPLLLTRNRIQMTICEKREFIRCLGACLETTDGSNCGKSRSKLYNLACTCLNKPLIQTMLEDESCTPHTVLLIVIGVLKYSNRTLKLNEEHYRKIVDALVSPSLSEDHLDFFLVQLSGRCRQRCLRTNDFMGVFFSAITDALKNANVFNKHVMKVMAVLAQFSCRSLSHVNVSEGGKMYYRGIAQDMQFKQV